MKKLLIAIVAIAGIASYFYFRDSGEAIQPTVQQTENTQIDPSNATFTFDDGAVTLSKGVGKKEDEGGFSETVELLDEKASGDLNSDGRDDVVVLLARSGGGSGVFVYIAAYVSGPVSYRGTDAFFIGDRISPQTISISNGVATFKYLDRSADEPFASEPTIPVTETYVYQNGAFRKN